MNAMQFAHVGALQPPGSYGIPSEYIQKANGQG